MIISETDKRIVFESEYFNLTDTLECGQVFRFEKSGAGYSVISKDKHCYAETDGSKTVIETDDTKYFRRYFALDADYESKYKRITALAPEFAAAAEAGKGIRLLAQDPFEMVISFIISANNNIPRIKGIINRICAAVGDKHDWGFAFPSPEQLCSLSESDFKSLGAGYRASYLYSAARMLSGDFINAVAAADTREAMRLLLTIKGVGKKVADCIMLFGLGRGDTFPVDIWMQHALETAELNTNEKIRDHYINKFGELSGLAQQYIYHYNRNVLDS